MPSARPNVSSKGPLLAALGLLAAVSLGALAPVGRSPAVAHTIEIENRVGGAISVVFADGRREPKGRVLRPATALSREAFTASSWAKDLSVAATAVNAIHLRADAAHGTPRLLSLLPVEAAPVGSSTSWADKRSFAELDASILTDIPGGTAIFAQPLAPYVGDRFRLEHSARAPGSAAAGSPVSGPRAAGSTAPGASVPAPLAPAATAPAAPAPVASSLAPEAPTITDGAPVAGDTLLIEVSPPDEEPREIHFENTFGGLVTLRSAGGQARPIARVMKPVFGVGRFLGTAYAGPGRVRANHPGVLCVSTAALGETGGFQVIPDVHAMSPEMENARFLTQWLVVGPLEGEPGMNDRPPLFSGLVRPGDEVLFEVKGREAPGPLPHTLAGRQDRALYDMGLTGFTVRPTPLAAPATGPDRLRALGLLGVFVAFAALMATGRLSALVALPLMALSTALVAGVAPSVVLGSVIGEGAGRLHGAIVTVILGAALAHVVKQAGVAEALISRAAELGGERKLLVALALSLATALLFTVLGGLGAVVMVATIVLPVLVSTGVPRVTAGALFLFAMSLGGLVNLTNLAVYQDVLGLGAGEVLSFMAWYVPVNLVVLGLFLVVELRLRWTPPESVAAVAGRGEARPRERVSPGALLTPLVPVALVFGSSGLGALARAFPHLGLPALEVPIVPALLVGIVWGALAAARPGKGVATVVARACIEGASEASAAVVVLMGIGMVLVATMRPEVARLLGPATAALTPHSRLGFVLVFTALAPLALYRGPLNVWGMGSGVIGLLAAAGTLGPRAIMAALVSVGQIQGISDPTNTHNVWIANWASVDARAILARTLPWAWLLAAAGLVIGGLLHVS